MAEASQDLEGPDFESYFLLITNYFSLITICFTAMEMLDRIP